MEHFKKTQQSENKRSHSKECKTGKKKCMIDEILDLMRETADNIKKWLIKKQEMCSSERVMA